MKDDNYWFNQRMADLEFAETQKTPAPAVTPKEIGVSGKGYWLFDRNGRGLDRNEGFLGVDGRIHKLAVSYCCFPAIGAIYKWIPSHRS